MAVKGVPEALAALPPVIVVCGHYGVGKTNFCLNLALDFAGAGCATTLVDLDVVNPYFRSSDSAGLLQDAGVRLIAPLTAGTSLDSPALPPTIDAAIDLARDAACAGKAARLVIDAGGDDVGSAALGRYSGHIMQGERAVLFVVNAFRDQGIDDSMQIFREVQAASRLAATAIVNNSHLMGQTTPAHVREGRAWAVDFARRAGLPLLCTAVPVDIVDPQAACEPGDYPVRKLVRVPWEGEG